MDGLEYQVKYTQKYETDLVDTMKLKHLYGPSTHGAF